MPGDIQTSEIVSDRVAQKEGNRLLYWISLLRKRINDLTTRIDVIESTIVATNHADLVNLDYDNSGHTGFQEEITNEITLISGSHSVVHKVTSNGVYEIWLDGVLVSQYPQQ